MKLRVEMKHACLFTFPLRGIAARVPCGRPCDCHTAPHDDLCGREDAESASRPPGHLTRSLPDHKQNDAINKTYMYIIVSSKV